MVNINKLKGKIVENKLSVGELASKLGINRSTLYRKLNEEGDAITIKEANLIVAELKLNTNDAIDIFFG